MSANFRRIREMCLGLKPLGIAMAALASAQNSGCLLAEEAGE